MSDPTPADSKQPTTTGRFRAALQRFLHHPAVDFIVMTAILISVGLLFVELEMDSAHEWYATIVQLGMGFTGFFIVELSLRWYASPSNRRFWREYWLDVLAVIPFLRPLRIFRILRVLRIYRMGVLARRFISGQGEHDYEFQIREEIAHYRGTFAPHVWLAPDLYRMLATLLEDGRVHKEARQQILTAMAYFITPFEVLPRDLHGPEGYLDQVYVALETIDRLRNELPDWLLQESWEGEGNILEILEERDDILAGLEPGTTEQIARYLGWEVVITQKV